MRAPEEEIVRQVAIFEKNETLDKFLGNIPAIFFVVNKQRQIVYINKGALKFTGLGDAISVVGKRPGEVFGCVHAKEEEGGCGTSESCEFCGAVRAILKSQQGVSAVEEARLILGPNEESYDLRIWAAPLQVLNEEFYAVTIQDISNEKRRMALERAFFHDILNTASGVLGTVEILRNYWEKIEPEEFLQKLDHLVKNLIDEIQSQRFINQAEQKELQAEPSTFNTMDLLQEMQKLYSSQILAKDKEIQIDPNAENITMISDRTLLKRIISNSVKNALEATAEGLRIRFNFGYIIQVIFREQCNCRSFSDPSQLKE